MNRLNSMKLNKANEPVKVKPNQIGGITLTQSLILIFPPEFFNSDPERERGDAKGELGFILRLPDGADENDGA